MDIRWLTDELPRSQAIQRRTEADYYGASDLISAALGYNVPPPSVASWKHGVSYEKQLEFPELMLTEGNRATRHLVGNDSQVRELKRRGYLRVHAIGVPFLYVEPSKVRRIPRSLLIMPAHSLINTSHSFNEEAYVEQLHSIRRKFDVVVACISAPCVRKGSWTHAFEKAGIPWLAGADSSDKNALRRMGKIFGTFEFMTTNTLGSHIAYAAYSGCRVSIWGPYAEYKLEEFKGIAWYEKNWKKLPEFFAKSSESYVMQRDPWLFREPWESLTNAEWAEPIVGLHQKREPSEVAQLLGWSTIGHAEVLLHSALRWSISRGRSVHGKLRRLTSSVTSGGV